MEKHELESVSLKEIQLEFKIGVNAASSIFDDLEKEGVISEFKGGTHRIVLI